jgi:di/tripeptidase
MSLSDVQYLLRNHREETIEKADQLIDILEPLIRIYSPTCKENMISSYVLEKLHSFGNNLSVDVDDIGNVYVTNSIKNEMPKLLLNAHLDIDCNNYKNDGLSDVTLAGRYEFDECGLLKPVEYDNLLLGYDDKIGVAIILWLLKYHPDFRFKAIFTVHEEAYHDTPTELREYKK